MRNNAVDKVNSRALDAMKGIPGFDQNFFWQYYKLKGVQGVPTSDEATNDFYLANNVVESSQPGIQLFRGGLTKRTTFPNIRNHLNVRDPKQNNMKFSAGGCLGCHGVAQVDRGFDFSFLYAGKGGRGFKPDAIGLQDKEKMSG